MTIDIVLNEQAITRKVNENLIANLGIVETPTGSIVAFEYHPTNDTLVAGYFLRELKPEEASVSRRIEIKRQVPKELQNDVSRLLKENGYLGPFLYWDW